MLTDIEIAQQAKLVPISKIASELGITEEELEPYGRFKAKLNDSLYNRLKDRPDGKLILVTAINPTPAGEGKTTTTAGLGQAMKKIGKNAIIALREPSELRAERQAADMRKFCQWRTSTCTLRATCTPLLPPTICFVPCWTITCSRAMHSASTSAAFW